jgi:hypothetical protein
MDFKNMDFRFSNNKYFTDIEKEFALKPDNFFTGENKCTRCCEYSHVCHCDWPPWGACIIKGIFDKEILKRKLSTSEKLFKRQRGHGQGPRGGHGQGPRGGYGGCI